MSEQYRALVEAAVDNLEEEGATVLSSDSLARAVSLGFHADTFEADVNTLLETRQLPADPRQFHLNLSK